MTQQLVGASAASDNQYRSLIVRDASIVSQPIALAVALANVLKRGTIVFGAAMATNMAQALDAGLPVETDFIYILPADAFPDVAVVAGDKFVGYCAGEFNRDLIAAANPGISGANLLVVEELMAKRGMHLIKMSYGDEFTLPA